MRHEFFITLVVLLGIAFGAVVTLWWVINPKEACLRSGGTAVEQPAGTFVRCIL